VIRVGSPTLKALPFVVEVVLDDHDSGRPAANYRSLGSLQPNGPSRILRRAHATQRPPDSDMDVLPDRVRRRTCWTEQ
jgi:hypothetical protein